MGSLMGWMFAAAGITNGRGGRPNLLPDFAAAQ